MKTQYVCFGLVALFATLGMADSVHAQNDPPNKTKVSADAAGRTPNQWGEFATALSALSQKYQMALVCESAPLHPTLSPEAAAALQTACAAPGIPAQEAIAAVARAYDYEAAFVDNKTVLFSKRYSDPQDVPEIGFDELSAFLNQLQDETKSFLGPPPFAPNLIVDLLRNASQEQEAAYAKGVRWDALPPSFQKRFAYAQAWGGLGSSLRSVEDLANRINGMGKPKSTVFKMAPFQDTTILAYEGPFGAPNATDLVLVPLSTTVRATPGGGITISASGKTQGADGGLSNAPPLGAVPKPLLPCQTTLKTWANAMNSRAAPNGGLANAPVRVEVPGSIAGKTVSLFGTERLTPAQTIKAIIQVLGLRGGIGSDKVARLLLPTARPISDPNQIGAETLRLMPNALLRALRYRPNAGGQGQRMPGEPVIDTAKAERLYAVIVQRLRQAVEPKLAASAEKTLPVDTFPTETKDALGLSILAGNADVFNRLTQEPPTVWRRGVPGSSLVSAERKPNGSIMFQFSSPGTNGVPGQSLQIVSGPTPR